MRLTKKSFVTLGIIFWISASVMALLPSWPHLYYRLFPDVSSALASTIASTVAPNQSPAPTTPIKTPETKEIILPDIDPSLPKENGLIIDKIGVKGLVHEGTDWENILKLGIWRAPEFGNPEDNSKPIILAAHRWGYLQWSAAFRKLNSFYALPNLVVGDTIKVIWNQRPYEYKVYSVATGTKISEYKANLILYTCQMWNSPERFFVYANRI
ncbi:MAG TPA: sortase [Spirochaetia bacterium]|nr:sortase [Spirochaetia bacterium]